MSPPPPRPQPGAGGVISGPLGLSYLQQQQQHPPLSRSSLGSGTIHRSSPALLPVLVQPPTAPQSARHAPVLRALDDGSDFISPVPAPPIMIHTRAHPRGRSLTARQSAVAMPPIPESPLSPRGPNDGDIIPAAHKRVPERIRTQGLAPPPRDDVDDDGFTPVTPAAASASPRSPLRRWLSFGRQQQSPTSPRDALGIPVSKWRLGRNPSRRLGDADDLEPLSPQAGGLPVPVVQPVAKKRGTVRSFIDGWWDLNLLEKSKSLRQK